MVRAILSHGVIHPIDPLPEDWSDGRELLVEDAEPPDDKESIDRWYEELEAMCAEGDPEDSQRLEAALREAKELAKAQMRREMGLP